jgi:Neuroendocrine protein 7B2 precursor (Secretogranin V)
MTFDKKIFLLATVVLLGAAHAYYTDLKEPTYINDVFMRDLFSDILGRDTEATADSDEYVDDDALVLNQARLALMARVSKDQSERLMDYDSLIDRPNPHPSLRDSEHIQNSALWGYQFMSGGAGEGPHVPKPQVKTDAKLPAYCNPPNPCPVGYSEDQGCISEFENTASFSLEYQASQECMCDTEHMFECPANTDSNQSGGGKQNYGYIARQFPQEHKSLVAKKFWVKKVSKKLFVYALYLVA